MSADQFNLNPIGIIHSCYKEKFGTPRQPGLVQSAKATIELLAPYNQPDYVRGLDEFSHIWVLFIFHVNVNKVKSATVRPPRLGGNKRLGVFATRAPFRPNNIGMSAVALDRIDRNPESIVLHISGSDLIDGTPVIDIKPYVPYADRLDKVNASYASQRPVADLSVIFADELKPVIEKITQQEAGFLDLLTDTLMLDPRPAYHEKNDRDDKYGMKLLNYNIKWLVKDEAVIVYQINECNRI